MLSRAASRTWIGWTGCLLMGTATASDRRVESLQPLLVEAVREGQAAGVLVGPMADTLSALFKTSAPLKFSVRAVGSVGPTCRRLEVTATQDGVWDRNSTRALDRSESRRLVYQVSICDDGSPPAPAAPERSR